MAYITNETKINVYREFDVADDNIEMIPDVFSDGGNNDPELEQALIDYTKTSKSKNILKAKPFPDWKTKNKSFIELHKDLKRLGIKKNTFFLALYDRDLQGIDPYSALPLEYQIKIMIECKRNPWYFLREVSRIPQDGKPIAIGGGSEFKIDRNSLASWYLFLLSIDHYQSKPRQTGKTQNALAEINYAFHFGAMSSTITFSNKDAANNKMNLYRLKCQRDMLPAYLQMKVMIDLDGKMIKESNNITTMRNPITNNTITLLPRANSEEAANSNGRGMTSSLGLFDEFDFTAWNTTTLDSSAFAYSTASRNAKENGSLTCRLFTSTPGDLDSRDGASAAEFIGHMLVWNDNMYDIPIKELKNAVYDKKSKRNGIVYVEHTWKQLKKTQEWYETQCQLVSFKQETILREIGLRRLHGSNNSPFEREDILQIQSQIRDHIAVADYSKNLCPIYIYDKISPTIPYILCCDPSDGLGRDNNAMTLIHPETLLPIAEYQSPYISQTDMGEMVVKFMDDYCPKAIIIIENNKGRELINCLRRSKYEHRIWYNSDKLLEINEKLDAYGRDSVERSSIESRTIGLNTAKNNRPVYYSILERIVIEEKHLLKTPFIINDVASLVRKPNGRVEAGPKKHDDNIMSYLMGLYVYYHAKNLAEFGLIKGKSYQAIDTRTPEEISVERMREMFNSMPRDLQELAKDSLFQMSDRERAAKYNREIEIAKRSDPMAQLFGDIQSQNIELDEFTMMNEYERRSFETDLFNTNYTSNRKEFDIDDYI